MEPDLNKYILVLRIQGAYSICQGEGGGGGYSIICDLTFARKVCVMILKKWVKMSVGGFNTPFTPLRL